MCLAKGVALLAGVTLLEWVWPCWRKCVTVGVGFATLFLAVWKTAVFCSPLEQDVDFSSAMPTWMLPCFLP